MKEKIFNRITKMLVSLSLIFALFITLPVITVNANEETDRYELTEIRNGEYKLEVFGNPDLSSLANENVISAYFNNNNLQNISVIESFNKLEKLNFSNCESDDLTKIPYVESLKHLEFFYCNLKNISGIERFTALETLYFSTVGIDDIGLVSHLTNLTDLALEYTNVSDLSPLEALNNLKILDVDDSLRVTSLDVVKKLTNLKQLYAKNYQMALTEDVIEHLKNNRIKTDLTIKDLDIKNDVVAVFDSLKLDNMSDTEKIDEITSYIVDNMTYDFHASDEWYENGNEKPLEEYNDNALEYALKGVGCCRNYSAFLTVLLLKAGIDAYEVRNFDHIWNMVVLDGYCYWIDTIRIDEIGNGDLKNSSDYMTQDGEFLELHKALSLPSNYSDKIKTDESQNMIQDNEKIVTKTVNVGVIILIAVVGAVIILCVVVNRNKKNNKEKV